MRISGQIFYLGVFFHLYPPAGMYTCASNGSQPGMIFDETCPTDCSQTEPRMTGDDTIFNCSVGNLSEVKKFRANFKKKMEEATIKFDPPKLIGIDFYHKRYQEGVSEGALNITFQLPKGERDSFNDIEYTTAVFLHFQSVDDLNYRDKFYYENPRERIFMFLGYKPKTYYDSEHPRNISYDCMVGLDDSKPGVAYMITLESAFGGKITYNCTVHVQQGNDAGYTTEWLPTIATYLNSSDRSVQVVFEEFKKKSEGDSFHYYNVSLLGQDRIVMDYKKIHQGTHETIFTNLKHGKYFVKVSKCTKGSPLDDNQECCDYDCASAISYVIDATGIPLQQIQDIPITYTEVHDTLYLVLAVILGCLIGLILVVSLVLVMLKNRKKPPFEDGRKPTGLILYSSVANPNVIEKFCVYMQNICGSSVQADCLETMKFSDEMRMATFVITVVSTDAENKMSSHGGNHYRCEFEKVLSRNNYSNSIKIIPVTFAVTPNETTPGFLGAKQTCLILMEDIEKLYCRIHTVRTVPKYLRDKMDTKTYHTKSKEGSELKHALDNARKCLPVEEKNETRKNDVQLCTEKKPIPNSPEREKLSYRRFMDTVADINSSTSSIDIISLVSKNDHESPEQTPLLSHSAYAAIMKPDYDCDRGLCRNIAPKQVNERRRFHSENTPTDREQNFQDNQQFSSHQVSRVVCCPRPAFERAFSDDHYSRNTPHLDPSQPYFNQTMGTNQIYSRKKSANVRHRIGQPFPPLHNQIVSFDTNPEAIFLHNAHHCHDTKVQFSSPGYIYPEDDYYKEGKHFGFAQKEYHSYPQDKYSMCKNQTRQHMHTPNIPNRLPPKLEFQAVETARSNPPESKVQVQGEMSTAGRYSYPLSLNIKRDFHPDMFIPPDDLESCISNQDDNSSNDIMDQLANINHKSED